MVVAVKETGGQEEGDARMVNHLLQMTGPGSSWIPGCAVLAADAALPLMPWQRVRQHRRPLQTSASPARWKRVCAERWSVEGEEGGLPDQLRLQLPVGFHAEGLQPLALWQHAVQPLHQWDRLVDAHLYTPEDGRHLVDLLDLLRILGILLLTLLHEAIKSFHREVHLFKNNKHSEAR